MPSNSINPRWSAEDELSLLSSALEIANEPAESYNPRVNLFDRIGMNLENSFENRDVLDKVKELRAKYEGNFREIREGDDADIMSSAAFEISRKIWGDGGAIKKKKKKKKMIMEDEEMGTQSLQHGAYQVQGSKSSEASDHQPTPKKEVSNDSQPGGHQLTSEHNRAKDSKCFQPGAHQPTPKQKSAKVFRSFRYGLSQPPLLPLPQNWRPKLFRNFLPSTQPPLLPLPTSWKPRNSIAMHPAGKSCLPP